MIHLGMLLQENAAAIMVQEGKILDLALDLFTWADFGFPLYDDKEEDMRTRRKRGRRKRMRSREKKDLLIKNICTKKFLLTVVYS